MMGRAVATRLSETFEAPARAVREIVGASHGWERYSNRFSHAATWPALRWPSSGWPK